jgi:hypothetical protein
MPRYQGDIVVGATLYFSFNTRDLSGNPATLAGTPVVSVFKNGGTTACTTLPVLTVNNGQTGRHTVSVNTGVDTTFYAAGNDYSAVLTSGTVSGISVVSVEVASFSINNRTVASVLLGMATHTDATAIEGAITSLGVPLQATAYLPPSTPPTVVQIRQEMDANSTKLSNLDSTISSRLSTSSYTASPTVSAIQSGLATHSDVTTIQAAITALGTPLQATAYVAPTTPPTVVQIRQEMDANSTKLSNLDATVSSRLATSSYTASPTVSAIQSGLATHSDVTTLQAAITALGTPLQATAYVAPTTPPTVVQIRQEMDANSTKLSNLDATVSSRLATSSYTAPPTVLAIQSGLAAHSDVTTLQAAITALGTPLQATSYVAPTTPPTVVQIRQEMDANSTKLNFASTSAGVTAAANAILAAVGSPLQSSNYVIPPSAAAIAATTAAVLFVDGATNPLKVNSDHSVSSGASSTPPISIVVPAAIAVASQDPLVMTCLRGDTLRFTLPVMGNLSNRTKLVFTAKGNVSDSDSMAVLQILEGTGLARLNGSSQVNPGEASLIVTSVSTGEVNLEIDASVTAALAVQDLVWDVQAILSTGVTTPVGGSLTVVADVTRSVT